MRSPSYTSGELNRPLHSEIRMAIHALGENGIEEVREVLHADFEPFAVQMDRRMKTRHPDLRGPHKVLRAAGEAKVRRHLAVIDQEGLVEPTPRRERPPFDRNRLKRRRARSQSTSKTPVTIS